MKTLKTCKVGLLFQVKRFFRYSVIMVFLLLWNPNLLAHCDRENGPVAIAAKEALKTENIDRILIWVGEEEEQELREKFQQSLQVFKEGGGAAELAEKYFMETAVRLHRAAEGMPFEGLKPASPNPPDIEAAEKALETGNFEPVKNLLCSALEEESSKWFEKARTSAENKEKSVAEGREWVNNYVKYIVYIHKLYQAIQAGPPHGVDAH
ncbi:DUF6448 family protein [Salinimicrobium xinjiangense]|uniref:DUF6448 family protein n=1 Tax=Salinimicrobium xinjiangense TaxID=438596 RepID=UPI00040CA360|nr:DUF6448 family protein [Salinimicrobium xinjiangense]